MTANISPLPDRLRHFVLGMDACLDGSADEQSILNRCRALMEALVAHDDWLPPAYAQADARHYRQYLLYLDPGARYSVVSFVWGPGQETPVHDHGTWGVIGMLRGAEYSRAYTREGSRLAPEAYEQLLRPGQTLCLSPQAGDIHRVRNASSDTVSISIHAYGKDIGAHERHVYDLETGLAKPFVSGYSNA